MHELLDGGTHGAKPMLVFLEDDARQRQSPRGHAGETDLLNVEVDVQQVRVVHLCHIVVIGVVPEDGHHRPA